MFRAINSICGGTNLLKNWLTSLRFFCFNFQVTAQGQVERGKFVVEEYYQTRFEVNVTMPAFFFNSDPYIHGTVMANYTSGAPVRGNLTLRATLYPLRNPLAPPIDRVFTFEESYPFWLPKRIFSFYDDPYNSFATDVNSNNNYYGYNTRQPFLTFVSFFEKHTNVGKLSKMPRHLPTT